MSLQFLKDGRDEVIDRIVDHLVEQDDDEFSAIRCPHCKWQPSRASRWACVSGGGPEPHFASCGTVWNTFETAGRCPGCQHQWRWTSCLRCGQWSLHVEWYESSDRD
jgi:hypothetical protein